MIRTITRSDPTVLHRVIKDFGIEINGVLCEAALFCDFSHWTPGGGMTSTKDILDIIAHEDKNRPWAPATDATLVAFTAKYKKILQVFALGSIQSEWREGEKRKYATISTSFGIDRYPLSAGFHAPHHFLAVRPIK